MSEPIQGDNSDNLAVLPVKRKRGRPRKDPSINRIAVTQVPPGFGVKEDQPSRTDANVRMVGQVVTGVIEAAFDSGFFLTVRIGDSDTNLRGVVFKPGHYAPVTAENDVAPHAQMIRRKEIVVRRRKRSKSSTRQKGSASANQVYGLVQYTTNTTALKGRYIAPIAPSVPLVGARGTVVPVILQPANLSNGSTPQHQVHRGSPQDTMPLRDDEVHTVEPLAMLPPEGSVPSSQMPVSQNETPPSQPNSSQNAARGNDQLKNGSLNGGATLSGQEQEGKPIKSAEVHTQGELTKDLQLSSPSSVTDDKGNMPASQSLSRERYLLHEHPLRAVNSVLHMEPVSVSRPLKNYATGRMTELLLAVQENMTENEVSRAENLASGLRAGFGESRQ